MTKKPDRERILQLLSDTEGLSNLRIKTELNLSDERYAKVRGELIEEQLVKKYLCRGGGIHLTRKGEKETSIPDEYESNVGSEAELYTPFSNFLERQADEDEIPAIICRTHSLKARGQWQNPDITRIAIEHYRHLRRTRVVVTTYEVKQFDKWNVDAVYEAASHHRFSHEAYVVLEWPNGLSFSMTDPSYKISHIVRECRRYGVGLATLHPYYNQYRLNVRLEPNPRTPNDGDVDAWLDYVFSRNEQVQKKFAEKMNAIAEPMVATE